MATYLLAYHGGGMPASEDERARVLAQWGQWFGALGSGLVDGGNPVGQTRMIAPSGSVSDGGGANPVSGYTVIKADSMDAAVTLARGCPLLQSGGSIEVCETVPAM
ncbi:MAG TPA: hypothetical protein VE953_00985 [Terriglobales bacterium]|nr:hypothetical protein [Terriglobales bacterium]